MYRVFCDGNLLYDPRVEDLEIFEKRLKLEVNTTGAFDFKIYPCHPMYNAIKRLKSTIEVYQDNHRLFRGRVLDDEHDFFNAKNIICEGDLAFFNDSIIRPFEFQGSQTEFLQWIIDQHNSQVGEAQKFVLGNVTVETSTNYVNRSSINAMSSWEVIESRLLDLIGGFIMVRRENGVNYIDYLEDSNYRSLQEIKLGENLLDLNKRIKGQDIITALIPYGARLEDEDGNETDERLTIESVNDGIDYVYNQEAVDEYGWVVGTETWDDVTIAQNLLTRANSRLAELVDLKVSIEVKAVDLSMTSAEFDEFRFFEYVKVDSPSHLLDDWMLISKLEIDMENPANNTLTLGLSYATFTQRQLETEKAIKNVDTIKGPPGKNGESQYIYIRYSANANGNPMTTTPNSNTKYIGVVNTTSSAAPGYDSYTWSKYVGDDGPQGLPGNPGENGLTPYYHQAWAEDKDGTGFSFTFDETKTWVGSLWDYESESSTNPDDYYWQQTTEGLQDQIDEKADNEYVTEVETALNSNMEQEAEAIRFEVSRDYTEKSEFETYQESQSTQYEQLYDSFNFTFSELIEQIDTLDGETKAQFEEIVKYIRFVDGNIILGEVGNEVTLRMTNNRIQFLQNGAEVAYFSDNMLYVTDIRVLNSLLIGAFGFFPRANGSLDFK